LKQSSKKKKSSKAKTYLHFWTSKSCQCFAISDQEKVIELFVFVFVTGWSNHTQ